MGSSTAAIAAETDAAWSPRRIDCPVVVVAGSVVVVGGSVVVVVGSALVVVSSVVVGSTVVVGAVTVGWVVVAPNVVRALVVVVRPTVADAQVVAGRVVAVGPLAALGAVPGLVADGAREVLGWRRRVVVGDAAVGAGSAGNVDSALPGGRPGVGGVGSWGTRAAEATRAARTEAVSPKAKSVSRQGCRGGSRCRGVAWAWLLWSLFDSCFRSCACPPSARRTRPHRTWPRTTDRTARSCPSMRAGMMGRRGGGQARLAIHLAIRSLIPGRPRCDRIDARPNLTCADASRRHWADRACFTHNPPVAGSRPAGTTRNPRSTR